MAYELRDRALPKEEDIMRYGEPIGRGVAAMDLCDWGWWYEENLDTARLDIKSAYDCVVGLRFGGAYKLGLLTLFGCRPVGIPADYGFAPGISDDAEPSDWDVLTREWVETIEHLRLTRGRTSGGPGWIAQPPATPKDMDPVLNGWDLNTGKCDCGTCAACRARELVAA
jgi:hypothetical protein